MSNLDTIDKQILALLQENSKINIKEIALKVDLTATPTYDRIKRMEKSGVIKRYVAELDKEKIGLDLVVFCNLFFRIQNIWIQKNHCNFYIYCC